MSRFIQREVPGEPPQPDRCALVRNSIQVALVAVALLTLSSEALGTVVSQTPYQINGGKSDFGNGSHLLGGPTSNGLVTWDLSVVNGVLTARATVTGRLYYDNLSGAGTAILRIEFKKVTGPGALLTIEARTITVNGPGGNANLAANQAPVNESFADRDLFTVLVSTFEVNPNGTLANGHAVTDSTDSQWPNTAKIDSGTADFGAGSHSFGSPTGIGSVAFLRSLPGRTSSPPTPLGNMFGLVEGKLYWDSLFDSGTARVVIDFQDANGNTLPGGSRTRDVNGPGGDANKSGNQLQILETFFAPSLFQIRLRVGTVSNGNFVNVTTRTFRAQRQ